MDSKTLIENICSFFRKIECGDKRYSQAWLSETDFGGVYIKRRFVLHVKTAFLMDDYQPERRRIMHLLRENVPEEYNLFRGISILDAADRECYTPDDLLVFDRTEAFNAA